MALEVLLSKSIISADYASLVLRIILGIIFIAHGWPKLKNLKGTAGFLGSIGFKPVMFWAFILAAAEFFGALAILCGFYSTLASSILIVSMLVATYLKAFVWKAGFAINPKNPNGYEFDLLIIASLIALILLGPGRFVLSF